MTALCSATKSATWLHRAQSVVPVSMENRSTMRVYAQDESPIRHNLLDAANHKRTSKAMMLPLHIGTGGVELKVDEFVPKTYRKYASSLPSVPSCPVVPTKDIPSPSVATEIPEEKFPGPLTENPDMESTRTSVNVVPMAPTATTSDLLGRSVRKFFDGFGWYDGKVTSRWESLDYGEQFHVVYTDGDSEDLTLDMLSPLLQPTSPIRLATEPSAVSRPCVADGVQGKGVDFPASCSLPTKAALPQEPSRRRRKSPLPAASASPDQRVTRGPSKVPSLPATSSVHELASSAPRATSFPRPAEVLDLTVSDDELVSSYSSMPPRSVQPQIHHQPTHATRGFTTPEYPQKPQASSRQLPSVMSLGFGAAAAPPQRQPHHPVSMSSRLPSPQQHGGSPADALRWDGGPTFHQPNRHRKLPSMRRVLRPASADPPPPPRPQVYPRQLTHHHQPQPPPPQQQQHQQRPHHPSRPVDSDWRSDDYVRRKRSSDALSSSSSWQEPHQVQSRRPPIDNSLVPPPKLHFQHRRHDMTAALPNQRPQPLGRAPNLLARLPSMMPANGGPPPPSPPPIAAFNDMLYDAIQRATTVESFGRKFVRVLLDDPQYDNFMDVTRLSVRCGQRRYRMLERFMEDVWLLSDTAKHMFPVDKALHDQAAAFVSALSNVLRELKVPLRALQGQLT